jgi:hypothetical protein
VDYKTSANPTYLRIDREKLDPEKRETWEKAIGSIQLPFYLLLYSEKKNRPVTELNALFLLLGRSRISSDIEIPLFDGPSAYDIYGMLKTVIFKLLREITDPFVPFNPAIDKKKVCPLCDFQYICGTQWVVN